MKTLIRFIAAFSLATSAWAGSIPNVITYQGTIKQSNVPIDGPTTMSFRITNADGTIVYWSSGNMTVQVNQGLFATTLAPLGVDWQNVIPYVETSVGGQTLTPREVLTANPYALMAANVADGSVFKDMIAMFPGSCPTGWTRFAAMDGNFPMGGPVYGATGGSATVNTGNGVVFSSGQGSGSFWSDWRRADNGNPGAPASNLPPYLTVVYCQKL